MGDSSTGVRGSDRQKGRLSCEEVEGLPTYTILQETPILAHRSSGRPHHHHHHHSRTRSTGQDCGSTLSLNSSSSYHKFCNHSHHSSPTPSTPPIPISKFGRHDFCINLNTSTSSLNAVPSSSRMVRPGSSTSSGYLSKPNSPVPNRRNLLTTTSSTSSQKCTEAQQNNNTSSDTSDNSSPTSHMSSSSSSCSAAVAVANKGKGKKFNNTNNNNSGTSASYITVGGGGGGGGIVPPWSSGGERRSVHKQNLYVVSFPIILLFNIFRSLLYQLFVLLRYVYCTAVQRRHHYAELQRRRQAEAQEQQMKVEGDTMRVIDCLENEWGKWKQSE